MEEPKLEGVEPETVELQEDEPEPEMEDGREVDVDESEQQLRALSREELMEAIRAAGRATEILAAREQILHGRGRAGPAGCAGHCRAP